MTRQRSALSVLVALLCCATAVYADNITVSDANPTVHQPVTFEYSGDRTPDKWCFDGWDQDCTDAIEGSEKTMVYAFSECRTFEVWAQWKGSDAGAAGGAYIKVNVSGCPDGRWR